MDRTWSLFFILGLFLGFICFQLSSHYAFVGSYDFRNHRIADKIAELASESIQHGISPNWPLNRVKFCFGEGNAYLGVANVSLHKHSSRSPDNSSMMMWLPEKSVAKNISKTRYLCQNRAEQLRNYFYARVTRRIANSVSATDDYSCALKLASKGKENTVLHALQRKKKEIQ